MPKPNYISIPYGAIKSRDRYGVESMFNKFQFLMVRLKVYSYLFSFCIYILFQFLMVRLKEGKMTDIAIKDKLFQFLMVRLKAK